MPEKQAAVEPKQEFRDILWGTGRRKTSVARVRLARGGSGKITVNDRPFEQYFTTERDQINALAPLQVTKTRGKYDVLARVHGGGIAGQAGAMSLGISRALKLAEPSLEMPLKHGGLLTRDSRMKERKKYGLRGARRGVQFSKR